MKLRRASESPCSPESVIARWYAAGANDGTGECVGLRDDRPVCAAYPLEATPLAHRRRKNEDNRDSDDDSVRRVVARDERRVYGNNRSRRDEPHAGQRVEAFDRANRLRFLPVRAFVHLGVVLQLNMGNVELQPYAFGTGLWRV